MCSIDKHRKEVETLKDLLNRNDREHDLVVAKLKTDNRRLQSQVRIEYWCTHCEHDSIDMICRKQSFADNSIAMKFRKRRLACTCANITRYSCNRSGRSRTTSWAL